MCTWDQEWWRENTDANGHFHGNFNHRSFFSFNQVPPKHDTNSFYQKYIAMSRDLLYSRENQGTTEIF